MRNVRICLLAVLIFGINNLSQIQPVHGCSYAGEIVNITSYYDLAGMKIGEKKLGYTGIGADCSILNAIFPSSADKIYVQDKQDKIDLVDLSNEKWEITDQYQVGNLYNPLNIFENIVVENPNINDLTNKSNFEINLFNLISQIGYTIKIDLIKEISHIYPNATLTPDGIFITSNNNWLSFFSQIQTNDCTELCGKEGYYWLYRYNLQNGENKTYDGKLSHVYKQDFRSIEQFQISRNGRFVFVVEDYPHKEILSLDLGLNKSKELTNAISVRNKWIKGDSIYYINSEDSGYSVNYLNFTSGASETLIEFDDIYPKKIVISDEYILIADTRAVNGNFPLGNYEFSLVITSLIILLLVRKKLYFERT